MYDLEIGETTSETSGSCWFQLVLLVEGQITYTEGSAKPNKSGS